MSDLNVFRDLTRADGRLGFYTTRTRNQIPEFPGCYAWFLPLWLYREDLDELMQIVSGLLSYDKDPEKVVNAPFTWDTIKLRVSRRANIRPNENISETWKRILKEPEAKRALQQTLMEASLLMPPLYVGRTNNLKRRYLEHTTAGNQDSNTFRSRFTEQVAKLGLKIGVSDLLFICIRTPQNTNQIFEKFDENEIESLIEQILMQFCRPPFSLR